MLDLINALPPRSREIYASPATNGCDQHLCPALITWEASLFVKLIGP